LLDAINIWWSDDIVHYDFSRQYRFLASLRSGTQRAGLALKSLLQQLFEQGRQAWRGAVPQSSAAYGTLGLIILISAAAAYLVWRSRRYWLRRAFRQLRRAVFPQPQQVAITGFYGEVLELLQAHGLTRNRGDTPLEFANSLKDHPVGESIGALTELYQQMRFGGGGGAQELSEARKLLGALKKILR
jgi:hypothetical protein